MSSKTYQRNAAIPILYRRNGHIIIATDRRTLRRVAETDNGLSIANHPIHRFCAMTDDFLGVKLSAREDLDYYRIIALPIRWDALQWPPLTPVHWASNFCFAYPLEGEELRFDLKDTKLWYCKFFADNELFVELQKEARAAE